MASKQLQKLSNIIKLNLGFIGIQYSFGLQQTAINPIFKYLGASDGDISGYNIAGPITGLLIQPFIGSLSDNTWSPKWGRRKPYFLIGAIICSLALFLYPFCPSLWLAVGLLWILDAGNNTAMEPYRAFIADYLDDSQQSTGFLIQSFFTGLGITLANFSLYFFQKLDANHIQTAMSIPRWVYGSFVIGAVISIASVWYSVKDVKETEPSSEELIQIKNYKFNFIDTIKDILSSFFRMPKAMWFLFVVYIFQWYALFIYWQFNTQSIAISLFNSSEVNSLGWNEAVGWSGFMNGTYNAVTCFAAFSFIYIVKKIKPEIVHCLSLLLGGLGLYFLPSIDSQYLTLIPMIGLGIAWASIMGVPYIFIVKYLPKNKYGVYMGIINMMIVIPMLIQTLTFGYIFDHFLKNSPQHAISLAGILLCIGGLLTAILFREKSNKFSNY